MNALTLFIGLFDAGSNLPCSIKKERKKRYGEKNVYRSRGKFFKICENRYAVA